MKKIWNGAWTLILVSAALYTTGYFLQQPLLMWGYEVYEGGYWVETTYSVLPLVIGSAMALYITRHRR